MNLKVAVQKSGRLYDDSIALLKQAGFKVDTSKGQLKAPVKGSNMEIYFLRNSDIPRYLEDGVVDIAIIGQNVLVESRSDVEELVELGFSSCRLSIATPKNTSYDSFKDLAGKKIATSYPNTLTDWLANRQIEADIHTISGSVEIAPNIGLADAICDLVSTGSTLFSNGLVEREIMLNSQAVLAANKNALREKKSMFDQMVFRIKGVLRAKENRYILFNIPTENIEKVSSILPVLRSPTVLPLIESGWSSLHTVINKKDYWHVIDKLKQNGAEGILVIPIENMIL